MPFFFFFFFRSLYCDIFVWYVVKIIQMERAEDFVAVPTERNFYMSCYFSRIVQKYDIHPSVPVPNNGQGTGCVSVMVLSMFLPYEFDE